MANPEDIVTDDLTKNEDGQYVNKAGEIVAVDSIAYRNERLEARKREAIDDMLGKDTSTEVEDPNHARDAKDHDRRKAAAKKAKAKSAAKPAAKAEPASTVTTSGPTGTSTAGGSDSE